MGLGPFKARECSQDPIQGSQEQQSRRDLQKKEPREQHLQGRAQQGRLRLSGKLALSGEGRCVGKEGTGTEPNPAPVGATEPAAGAVVCSGGREGAGSRASGPRGSCSCGGQGAGSTARGHCSSSEDSWEMPSSSSFSCRRQNNSGPGPPPLPTPPSQALLCRRGMSQG